VNGQRHLILGVAGGLAAAALVGAPAAGATDGSLKGLVLSGTCPGLSSDLKNVVVAPKTATLWAPVRIYDNQFRPTGKWLFPYRITVEGPGLKTRHLTPGEAYVRPGAGPFLPQSTCLFNGATKEDGPFQVAMTGAILGR
jgi:hypothetical protein